MKEIIYTFSTYFYPFFTSNLIIGEAKRKILKKVKYYSRETIP